MLAVQPDEPREPGERAAKYLSLVEQVEVAGAAQCRECVRQRVGRAMARRECEVRGRVEAADGRPLRLPAQRRAHGVEAGPGRRELLGELEQAACAGGHVHEGALVQQPDGDLARRLGEQRHAVVAAQRGDPPREQLALRRAGEAHGGAAARREPDERVPVAAELERLGAVAQLDLARQVGEQLLGQGEQAARAVLHGAGVEAREGRALRQRGVPARERRRVEGRLGQEPRGREPRGSVVQRAHLVAPRGARRLLVAPQARVLVLPLADEPVGRAAAVRELAVVGGPGEHDAVQHVAQRGGQRAPEALGREPRGRCPRRGQRGVRAVLQAARRHPVGAAHVPVGRGVDPGVGHVAQAGARRGLGVAARQAPVPLARARLDELPGHVVLHGVEAQRAPAGEQLALLARVGQGLAVARRVQPLHGEIPGAEGDHARHGSRGPAPGGPGTDGQPAGEVLS